MARTSGSWKQCVAVWGINHHEPLRQMPHSGLVLHVAQEATVVGEADSATVQGAVSQAES